MSGPLDFEREPGDEADRPSRIHRPPAPAEPPPPARPAGRSRFTWVIGIAFLLVLVTIVLSAVGSSDVPPGGPAPNDTLPPFATPLATSSLDYDANVATAETKGSEAGERPACEVRGREILNICELTERGPVVLALFPTDARRCRAVLRQLDRAQAAFGTRVAFAAVGSRGDREELRGHRFPVGWDADGAIATVYGLAGCPQITYVRQGGRVAATTRRELTDAELRRRIEALLG